MDSKSVPQLSHGGSFNAKRQDFLIQDDATPHFGGPLDKTSEETVFAEHKVCEEREAFSKASQKEPSRPLKELTEEGSPFQHGLQLNIDDAFSAQSTQAYPNFPSFCSLDSSSSLAPGSGSSAFASSVFPPPVLINRSASTSDQSSSRKVEQDLPESSDPPPSGESEAGASLPYLLLTEALSVYPSKSSSEGEASAKNSRCAQEVPVKPSASEVPGTAGDHLKHGPESSAVPEEGATGRLQNQASSVGLPGVNTQILSHTAPGTCNVAEELTKMIREQTRPKNNHCIDVDADKMFEALSVAWGGSSTPVNEAGIGSQCSGVIHRGAVDKVEDVKIRSSPRPFPDTDKHVLNDPASSYTPSHHLRNSAETLSGDTASPDFIGRRHTFPGCPPVLTEDVEGAFVSENNASRSAHRRRTGPFSLPFAPLDAELENIFRWGEGQETEARSGVGQGSLFDFPGTGQSSSGPRPLSDLISRGSRHAGGGPGGQAKYTLIVNVPPTTTRQDLYVTFSAFGKVELTVVVCDKDHRHPNREWTATSGYAFVRFSKSSEAAAAVAAAASGTVRLRGSRVRATWAKKDSLPKHSNEAPPAGSGSSNQAETSPRTSRSTNRRPQIGGDDGGSGVKIPLSACLEPKSAQEFACRLCRQYLAADPVVLPCWHMFCTDCLETFASFQDTVRDGIVCDCPECGLPASSSAVRKMDEATTGPLFKLRQVRDAEAVACPFNPYCQWNGQVGSFAAHMRLHCPPSGKSFSSIAELFSTDFPSSAFGQ